MDEARGPHDSCGGKLFFEQLMNMDGFVANTSRTRQRALANQPWKEYTAEGGRKYWYNTETKQSSWEMPDAYRQALGISSESTPTYVSSLELLSLTEPLTQANRPGTPHPGPGGHDYSRDYRDHGRESRQLSYGHDSQSQAFFVPASTDPEYATPEEAEAAFIKMLRRCGVQPDWTWEQTVRVTVKDPQHRAIKDPRERKDVFEKFCRDMITQDKERAKERLAKLRADFETMLKRHPEIKYYTRWKTARPMIEGETLFRSTDNENERRQLFQEYILGLKQEHVERQAAMRKDAMSGLIDLLSKLNLEPYTRWSDAQGIISSTQPFQNDEKYKALSKFDILTAFQNHMKALERAFNDSKQEQKNKKYRRERQNRDAFNALLSELRRAGKINAGTKWRQIHPLLENDERYIAMAGQSGSTPQELFWDVVEEEERGLRGTRNEVLDVLDVSVFVFFLDLIPLFLRGAMTDHHFGNRTSGLKFPRRLRLTNFCQLLRMTDVLLTLNPTFYVLSSKGYALNSHFPPSGLVYVS